MMGQGDAEPRRLHADHMLGRLARWLRAAGWDVTWEARPRPWAEVLLRARREGRWLLSRNRSGAWYPGQPGVLILQTETLREQLAEVFAALGAPPEDRRFTRCTLCNTPLKAVPLEEARPRLPRAVRDRCREVWSCPACRRLYWEGTHVDSMERVFAEARELARSRSAPAIGELDWGRVRSRRAREQDRFDAFLRELFRRTGYSWAGFRRKRRGLRSKILGRIGELGLDSLESYLDYLRGHPEEEKQLHKLLAVTVTRFFRDRTEWFRLRDVFPELAAGGSARAWSVGCASGEEPYTLRILWTEWEREQGRSVPLELLATDISPECLERARQGVYPESAVHSVPEEILRRYFRREGAGDVDGDVRTASSRESQGESSGRQRRGEEVWRLDPTLLREVEFRQLDLLGDRWPEGRFDLILCRNFVFTYLDEPLRTQIGQRLVERLRPGGILMVGSNDRVRADALGLVHVVGTLWRKP
jgi:chemotaxis methyl-accepting protein methylase/uncharacterized protein with PIN domain